MCHDPVVHNCVAVAKDTLGLTADYYVDHSLLERAGWGLAERFV